MKRFKDILVVYNDAVGDDNAIALTGRELTDQKRPGLFSGVSWPDLYDLTRV